MHLLERVDRLFDSDAFAAWCTVYQTPRNWDAMGLGKRRALARRFGFTVEQLAAGWDCRRG